MLLIPSSLVASTEHKMNMIYDQNLGNKTKVKSIILTREQACLGRLHPCLGHPHPCLGHLHHQCDKLFCLLIIVTLALLSNGTLMSILS